MIGSAKETRQYNNKMIKDSIPTIKVMIKQILNRPKNGIIFKVK